MRLPLLALSAGLAALALVPAPSPGQKAAKEEKSITNSIGMKLALIPAGEFMMGSPKDEKGRRADEKQHKVKITKAYYMGIHTVTQKQYRAVMGKNPSYFSKGGDGKKDVDGLGTDDFPVEYVSWEEAKEFCEKLTAREVEKKKGCLYRLPTEAEWEYSCRGPGREYKTFHFGDELNGKQANCDGNYPYGTTTKGPYLKRTCKVGSYKPNGFGLYDMHGNVSQWCSDWYKDYPAGDATDPKGPEKGSYRVLRGGSWSYNGIYCRSALRDGNDPTYRYMGYGFRAALDLTP